MFTNLTGQSLLETLRIRNRLANGLSDDFTEKEIYEVVKNCKKLSIFSKKTPTSIGDEMNC